MDLYYTLHVRVDHDSLDSEARAEIAESASSHDTDGGLRRFLGGLLNDAEDALNSAMPEGFWVKIKEQS